MCLITHLTKSESKNVAQEEKPSLEFSGEALRML